MDLNLKGKRVFVTGSSRGIGYAIAQSLYAEGCQVVLNGRTESHLSAALASLPGALGVRGDVSAPDEAKRVIDDVIAILGGLDILVCNVGSGRSVPPGQESFLEWQRVFALNFWSVTNTVEAANSNLVASQGVILCISSICGIESIPNAPITYSVAKSAIHTYVKGMARVLGVKGVRINVLAPGNIVFEGSVWERKLSEDAACVQDMLNQNVSLKKLGTLDDVAKAATYMVSPLANFITGSIWTVDGGQVRSY